MKLCDARALVQTYIDAMAPYCVRIEAAGSIRRGEPNVKDLEIVAIPRYEVRAVGLDLFTSEQRINLLHEYCTQTLAPAGWAQWIRTVGKNRTPTQIAPDGRWWKAFLPNHSVCLDLFLCERENWGNQFLLRTGPAEFGKALVTYAKRRRMPFQDARVLDATGRPLDLYEEADVFRALGLCFVPPARREGRNSLTADVARREPKR